MNTCDLVIFDMDGVLVDSEPIANALFVEMAAEHMGLVWTLEDAMRRIRGRDSEYVDHVLREEVGYGRSDEFKEEFRRRLYEEYSARLRPVDGVVGVIESLTVPRCVASNSGLDFIAHTLEVTGLLPLFEGRMFSADGVSRPKPAPDIFLSVSEQFGVEPARCIVIEDSVAGVLSAESAGMSVFGYAAGDSEQAAELDAAGATAFLTMDELRNLWE